MGAAAFIIAIMGCADGGAACTQVATLPARFESEAACYAATDRAIAQGARFDYPTILAQCQRAGGVRSVSSQPRPTDRGRSG